MRSAAKPALLLSSRIPVELESQDFISGGHRYCGSMEGGVGRVHCLCTRSGNDESDRRLEARNRILESLHNKLPQVLNEHHGSDLSASEWKLLVGHWLSRYVASIVQRYYDLERLAAKANWSGIVACHSANAPVAAPTTLASTQVFNSEQWDVYIKTKILSEVHDSAIWALPDSNEAVPIEADSEYTKLTLVKNSLATVALKISRFMSKRARLMVMASYLPTLADVRLHLAHRQTPQFWRVNSFQSVIAADFTAREQLSKVLLAGLGECPNSLEKVVYQELFMNLPTSMLEGFEALGRCATQQKWPDRPRVIFTSNAFDGDDCFERYVIEQKRSGAEYVVGQHGNNYGTLKTMSPSVEEQTSDSFITWGWKGGLEAQKPGFVIKLSGVRLRRRHSERYLLLQLHRENAYALTDVYLDHEEYFSTQTEFANSLDDSILQKLVIRLHPSSDAIGWGEREKWLERLRFPPKFSESVRKIYGEFSRSKLVIHSYDSTGLLECLAANIPTVAFWAGGLGHLNDSAKPYYELLVQAGIVHFEPYALAEHINDMGDCVDSWWYSESVQTARRKFCDQFAKFPSSPIRDLTSLLDVAN